MEESQTVAGMSIFQDSEQLLVDAENQRQLKEEEEAAADQQRRDAELQKLLTNAFDDLYDDNESTSSIAASDNQSDDGDSVKRRDTVSDRYHAALFGSENQDSPYILDGDTESVFHNNNDALLRQSPSAMERYKNSRNLAHSMSHQLQELAGGGDCNSVSTLHYQHCFRTSPGGGAACDSSPGEANEGYRRTSFNSLDQLQVLYEVRLREVQRLTEQLEQLKRAFAHEKDQLLRKLAFSEAEKERAQLMYKQVQGLLVEQKDRTHELEKKLVSLEAVVENLEKTKAELSSQLEASKTSVETLHQQLILMETAGVKTTDKQVQAFLHNVQTMHNEQMKKVEDELSLVVAKLSQKDVELDRSKQESERRSQQLEARLAEQADTLNQMARSLEESQRRCQQLMASDAAAEADSLRTRLEQSQQLSQALQAELSGTKRELETLRADMKQCEAVLRLSGQDEGGSGGAQGSAQGALQLLSTNKKLQEELHRALLSQREKRDEVSRLASQLATLQREDAHRQAQLRSLEQECADLRECLREERAKRPEGTEETEEGAAERRALELALLKEGQRAEELEEEVAKLRSALQDRPDLSEQYLLFHEQSLARALSERDEKHKKELDALSAELEQSRKESDSVKELYISACKTKEETLAALQDLRKTLTDTQAEVQTLSLQLERERTKVQDLEAQNTLFVDKLKQGRGQLEAAEKALAEHSALRAEAEALRGQLKDQAKISEEIERVKAEALLELKKNWQEGVAAQQALKVEQVYKDLTAAYAEKLQALKTEYGLKMQEISERVRDETMLFCIQQMRQLESKYLTTIKKCKENYEEQISTLQVALERSKAELLRQQEMQKTSSQGILITEKTLPNKTDDYDGHIRNLEEKLKHAEEKLKHTELKSVQAEKQLETTIKKYMAAKKAVHEYKKYAEAQKKHMEKEWVRINAGFQEALCQVHQKLCNWLGAEEGKQLTSQMEKILKQE